MTYTNLAKEGFLHTNGGSTSAVPDGNGGMRIIIQDIHQLDLSCYQARKLYEALGFALREERERKFAQQSSKRRGLSPMSIEGYAGKSVDEYYDNRKKKQTVKIVDIEIKNGVSIYIDENQNRYEHFMSLVDLGE